MTIGQLTRDLLLVSQLTVPSNDELAVSCTTPMRGRILPPTFGVGRYLTCFPSKKSTSFSIVNLIPPSGYAEQKTRSLFWPMSRILDLCKGRDRAVGDVLIHGGLRVVACLDVMRGGAHEQGQCRLIEFRREPSDDVA